MHSKRVIVIREYNIINILNIIFRILLGMGFKVQRTKNIIERYVYELLYLLIFMFLIFNTNNL